MCACVWEREMAMPYTLWNVKDQLMKDLKSILLPYFFLAHKNDPL